MTSAGDPLLASRPARNGSSVGCNGSSVGCNGSSVGCNGSSLGCHGSSVGCCNPPAGPASASAAPDGHAAAAFSLSAPPLCNQARRCAARALARDPPPPQLLPLNAEACCARLRPDTNINWIAQHQEERRDPRLMRRCGGRSGGRASPRAGPGAAAGRRGGPARPRASHLFLRVYVPPSPCLAASAPACACLPLPASACPFRPLLASDIHFSSR